MTNKVITLNTSKNLDDKVIRKAFSLLLDIFGGELNFDMQDLEKSSEEYKIVQTQQGKYINIKKIKENIKNDNRK